MADHHQATNSSDEQLIRATSGGDLAAFGSLVERYWSMVFALALSRINDPAEAEDVAQESFLKAYSQLRSLREPCRFAGWVSKIALQHCADTVRKNRRWRAVSGSRVIPVGDLEAMPACSSNPGLTDTQIQFVRQTVGELPAKFRKLIIMRFMGGLSAVQIAEQLGKRPGTVRVWLHRAYKMLRQDLAPLLEEVES
jgi:RNA polymerase sigma-70 factor (ECF subfamily)